MPRDLGQSARPLRLLAAITTIAALFVARDLLIPISLAVLLTLLLSPLVWRLGRMGIPRALAVVLVVAAAGAMTLGIGALVVKQGLELTARLPDYRVNLINKVRDIKSTGGGGTLAKVSGTIKELRQELATTNPSTEPVVVASDPRHGAKPMRVEVVESSPEIGDLATMIAGPLLQPLAALGITALLLIFLLLHSDDVRDRLIWLAGMRQISLTTSAADEVATRISRYLRMQLLINVCFGMMIFLGLSVVGVPNGLLWGAAAVALRFVPFLGPWIAGLLPTLLAAAVFPHWGHAFASIAVFAGAELVTNLVLEPWLYSASTGISSLGVVVAAVFWTWLWGPIGLILAVPMTVCLVVVGKHVPQFAVFAQLLGAESAVPMVGKLYQRLLVGDETASSLLVSEAMPDRRIAEVCDEVLLPVLREIKRDLMADVITRAQARDALQLLENLTGADELALLPTRSVHPTLLSIAVQNEVDDTAARLFAMAAIKEGIATDVVSSHALAGEVAARVQKSGPRFAVIVQVSPISPAHNRRIIKALLGLPAPPSLIIDLFARAPSSSRFSSGNLRSERDFSAALARLVEQHSVKPAEDAAPALAEPALIGASRDIR